MHATKSICVRTRSQLRKNNKVAPKFFNFRIGSGISIFVSTHKWKIKTFAECLDVKSNQIKIEWLHRFMLFSSHDFCPGDHDYISRYGCGLCCHIENTMHKSNVLVHFNLATGLVTRPQIPIFILCTLIAPAPMTTDESRSLVHRPNGLIQKMFEFRKRDARIHSAYQVILIE